MLVLWLQCWIASCALLRVITPLQPILASYIFSKITQQPVPSVSACRHLELRAGRGLEYFTSGTPHSARRRLRRCAPPPAARPGAPDSPLPASAMGTYVYAPPIL